MVMTMARPQSDNTFQVAFKIPEAWKNDADAVAEAMSQPGFVATRTDVLRAALARGLAALKAEHKTATKKRGK